MQFQANICNTDIVVPKVRETTALGTCFAAGLAVGFWDSLEDIKQRWVVGKKSETEEGLSDRYHGEMDQEGDREEFELGGCIALSCLLVILR